LKEILERLAQHDSHLSGLDTSVKDHTSSLSNHEARIKDLENRLENVLSSLGEQPKSVEIIERTIPSDSSSALDSEAARQMQDRLARLELRTNGLDSKTSETDKRLASTSDLATSTAEKLKSLEDLLRELQQKLGGLETKVAETDNKLTGTDYLAHSNKDAIEHLKKMMKAFDEALRNKVDSDDFDNLREYINSGAKTTGGPVMPPSGISSKDSNMIKDLKRRLDEMQASFEQQSMGGDRFEEIFLRFQAIEKTLKGKAEASDVDDLKGKTAKLRADVDRLMVWLQELENSKASTSDTSLSVSTAGSGPDNAKLARLARRVDVLEEEMRGLAIPPGVNIGALAEEIKRLWAAIDDLKGLFERLGKELRNKLKELENRMNDSISSSVLSDFEKGLLARIADLADDLGKKFADKQETRKALRHLDKLIRGLYEESTNKREGDDALFARKPLGGWSCASCEKGLEKLIGRVAPYTPWNKMPYRDPADRIARVGPGFSRMLATVQPEMMSTRSRQVHSKVKHNEYEYEEEHHSGEVVSLPPVKAGDRPFTSALP
jgi:chromosome segregation ATPase